ncbi:MAG: glucosamine 6-phosphate synthetase, contains amidotransferase and phosphosugar isomerase domain [Actinomycetia bacterium]|nr:glucosamine 6-phosphate synthetase, contains amidotransferase and phosphosugar isomerase domain [Actinomycetes bacterium]
MSPDLGALREALAQAETQLEVTGEPTVAALEAAAATLHGVDRALREGEGVRALVENPVARAGLLHHANRAAECLVEIESRLDAMIVDGAGIEALNAALIICKDALWSIRKDRIDLAVAIEDLLDGAAGRAALEAFHAVEITLSAIDRLEVRGRDSAGLHLIVTGHGLDLDDPTIARLVASRSVDPLFTAGSVRTPEGHLSFVYKTAAEIGELGDNTARLRAQIRADELLHLALRAENAQASVLAHTRWASIGIISEANAHPLNQEELDGDGRVDASRAYTVAALNGDVDNYADLKALDGLHFSAEITTDAKVIPALVARRIDTGVDVVEAFRSTVASFEGSVAIALQSTADPDCLLLAQRGSGQGLYVGLAPDAFVVASEPYGLVAECATYLRLDGESMVDAGNPASQGQVVVLDRRQAGTLAGVRRISYDGRDLPVGDVDLHVPQITTRDVDRGESPHYLLKEITEAPASFRKTLRAKIVEREGLLDVCLPLETLPATVRDALRSGAIQRVLVIGQGTAAIAGQSLVQALHGAIAGSPVRMEATLATELSGFGLTPDMSDTLVVATSQSGTTTDTNRTVDLARARGAKVIAIVNRRQSDLVDKSDGVLFTSDGRDLEMSVASTKAFYSQVAACFLLAFAIAAELGDDDAERRRYRHDRLVALRLLPDAMAELVGRRASIAETAQRNALSRRSWAVVGNGSNSVAAHEVRIKLSELCYKSIACDVTEDKKHIDLSAEPLILVCAAGLHGSNADDVAKEIAIYRAHKAAPIAIVDDGENRFSAAVDTISVPVAHPDLAFVLCTMAGHLFGYEAALAIDASARPLREARGCIETAFAAVRNGEDPLGALATAIAPHAARFFDELRQRNYDGCLEAATAVRLASVLRYATGLQQLDTYQIEFGKVGTPSTVVEDLNGALTKAIEELTRPIDAIKHQAKTVTVGISRSDETLLLVPIVKQVLEAGAPRDSLTYRALRTLVALDPSVERVQGWTRYNIEGETINVVDRGGIARDIPSRTDANPALRGSKHRAAAEREVTVVRGRADGRTMIFVPEVKGNQTTGLTLLHVQFYERLPGDAARRVLEGYRDRYQAIADQVTETEPVMRDDVLGTIDFVDLLTEPVVTLADSWRA